MEVTALSTFPKKALRRRRLGTVAFATSAVIAAVGLTSCSSGPSTSDDSVITIFTPQESFQDFDTNSFTKLVEDKFDVKLKFTTTNVDPASAAETRQITLASGDLPDMFLLSSGVDYFSRSELVKYGEQGALLPLNDLIKKDAPEIDAALDATPEYRELSTAPDGTIWGLPFWEDCLHCSYRSKFWINTDWLNKLGLAMPTTPDEFFNVMMAFKTEDPNGNGIADEIPMTGAAPSSIIPFLMNPFIYVSKPNTSQPASLGLDGDKVQLQVAQDGYREGLKFINKMWAAGLIDPAAFSQDYAAMIATGNHAGDIILGGGTVNDPGGMVTVGQDDKRDAVYNPVPPLTGPGGQNATYILPSVPGATFVLTSKASEAKQKKIMEIMNYLFSDEGHVRAEFGEEGVGWEPAGPGDIALDQKLTPTFKDLPFDESNPADYNGDWRRQAQYNETYDFRNSQVQPLDTSGTAGYERRLFDATQLYLNKPTDAIFPYWNVWVDDKDNAELSTLQVNVESFVSTATAEFVTGVRDPNSDDAWKQYLSDLDGLGAKRYIEIYQNAYDKVK